MHPDPVAQNRRGCAVVVATPTALTLKGQGERAACAAAPVRISGGRTNSISLRYPLLNSRAFIPSCDPFRLPEKPGGSGLPRGSARAGRGARLASRNTLKTTREPYVTPGARGREGMARARKLEHNALPKTSTRAPPLQHNEHNA